ncbi:MAG: DUF1080 domain-containing protein [Verrucomicrobia bacterium]|nr:DUF1080 domain-containing protein [Verrucomicrobiota bacterium]
MKPFVLLSLLFSTSLGFAGDFQLFNGQNLQSWKEPTLPWSVVGSLALDPASPQSFSVTAGTGLTLGCATGKSVDIRSVQEFGDCQVHVEFCVPKNSNSGIYFMGRYEVQILDSYGKKEVGTHDCGAIYQRWKDNAGYEGKAPRLNASKPPGEWQSFDVTFRAPRFDSNGKKVSNATFVKVLHNGELIHENVECSGPTRGSKFDDEAPLGPFLIQGDHGPVAFRSMLVTPM